MINTSEKWCAIVSGFMVGPMLSDQLLELISRGVIDEDSLIRLDGEKQWSLVSETLFKDSSVSEEIDTSNMIS